MQQFAKLDSAFASTTVGKSMDRPPPFFRTRQLVNECWLWAKTEWRFHLVLAVVAVAIGALCAFRANDPTLFARSGAIMTVFAAVMTYRGYFRRTDDEYMRLTGQADRRAFSYWHPFKSKDEAQREDRSAFRWGLRTFALGTLIWAYGDLWLPISK